MPELFGIYRKEGLAPEQRAAFDRMRDALQMIRAGTVEVIDEPWAMVGVMQWRRYDKAVVLNESTYRCAWIGNEAVASASAAARYEPVSEFDQLKASPPFAGCVLDLQRREFTLISDPFGFHPLYCAVNEANVHVFASKLGAVAKSGVVASSLDSTSIAQFMWYEHLLSGDP